MADGIRSYSASNRIAWMHMYAAGSYRYTPDEALMIIASGVKYCREFLRERLSIAYNCKLKLRAWYLFPNKANQLKTGHTTVGRGLQLQTPGWEHPERLSIAYKLRIRACNYQLGVYVLYLRIRTRRNQAIGLYTYSLSGKMPAICATALWT